MLPNSFSAYQTDSSVTPRQHSSNLSPTSQLKYSLNHEYRLPPIPSTYIHVPAQYPGNNSHNQQYFPPPYNNYYNQSPIYYKFPANISQQQQHQYQASSPTQPSFRHHKKSKSLPTKNQTYPLINKFQCNQIVLTSHKHSKSSTSVTSSAGSSTGEASISNNINFPISQLPTRATTIPLDKSTALKNLIYPSIEVKKYSTSAIDPLRNYLTVFEYSIKNHWIIWDYETGFVHLTGIWKASLSAEDYDTKANVKADIVKLLESTPKEYHSYIKRIRGGFLKIQGTWLPFNLCKILARRFCYYIRYELIPIFGIDFPEYCLKPSDKGFGELRLDEITNEGSFLIELSNSRRQSSRQHKRKKSNVFNTNLSKFSTISNNNDYNKVIKKEHKKKQDSSSSSTTLLPLPPPPSVQLLDSPILSSKKQGSIAPINTQLPLPSLPPPIPNQQRQHHQHDDLSYNEMVDIVNASKCLQSLSKSSPTSIHTYPICFDSSNHHHSHKQKNYIATSIPSRIVTYENSNGISSILLAAGLSENSTILPKIPATNDNPNKHIRNVSMKINDLLT